MANDSSISAADADISILWNISLTGRLLGEGRFVLFLLDPNL